MTYKRVWIEYGVNLENFASQNGRRVVRFAFYFFEQQIHSRNMQLVR